MSYKDRYADAIEEQFRDLENRIMSDVIRRIRKTGEITSTADWQINRLRELGYSSEDIEKFIMEALNATWPEMFELYDKVVDWEYVRNKKIYEQINAEFIPYDDNEQLKQWVEAVKQQTAATLQNFTRTMGLVEQINGQLTYLPLTDFYRKTLDTAIMDITSGTFDYNSTLRKVVNTLTRSGIRTIDYTSGYSSRLPVAARRAVMTGITQLTGQINEYNADKLGTEYFEVEWHANARPSHRVWQGKVWTKDQLVGVCGLGTVTGLCGANCYHTYYPFFPGISERNWTDEWLREQNAAEDEIKTFHGKGYTGYEATQKQRQMETSMRAQRQKVRLLEQGGAGKADITIAKARYQGQINEYREFSDTMGLEPQMGRVYIDGLGRVAPGYGVAPIMPKHNKTIDKTRMHDKIKTETEKRDDEVHFVGKIDREIYRCITEDIVTDEVVITEKQVQHIKERHPEAYNIILSSFDELLQDPDFIIRDDKHANTGLVIKQLKIETNNLQMVLRIATKDDDPTYRNSIISCWEISKRRLENYLKNKEILYKKE